MLSDDISMEAILTKLHYDTKWLTYGFVDQSFLRNQSERYDSGIDTNTEHYRYIAFCRLLDEQTSVDDLTMDRYIELAEIDDDKAMAFAALVRLIRYPGLTRQQLDRLKCLPPFAQEDLQRTIEEAQLLRDLDSEDIADGLFDQAMTFSKPSVQRKLLSKAHISLRQLEILRDRGASKAIRNLAQEKLRRCPKE